FRAACRCASASAWRCANRLARRQRRGGSLRDMATWAIGDVHGCYRSLRRLLRRPAVAGAERLWFVGDLVNRGPRSLEVLRCVADLGPRAEVVLGNHDLHFLARAFGVAAARPRDTVDRLPRAADPAQLVGWP